MTEERYAARLAAMRHSDVAAILRLAERPDVVSLAGGLPAPESLDIETLEAIERRVFRERGREALGYGPTAGIATLREELARFMTERGRVSDPSEILVTTGGIAALDLVAKAYLDPGDAVLVGAPSYLAALHVFRSYEARMIGVALDEEGMDPDALEGAIAQCPVTPKLLYLVPSFQNPTGLTLGARRRTRILEIALRHGIRVVEDGAYQDLRFEGEAPPLLCAGAPSHVIHINTLSKIVCPSLRLGWVAATPEIAATLTLCKQGQDQCSQTMGQWVARDFIAGDALHRHIERARTLYRGRRDAALRALKTAMPAGTVFTRPEGGFYTWVTLPGDVDTEMLLERAVAEHGVAFVAGAAFYPERGDPRAKTQLRLSYSYVDENAIEDAVARLGRAIADAS